MQYHNKGIFLRARTLARMMPCVGKKPCSTLEKPPKTRFSRFTRMEKKYDKNFLKNLFRNFERLLENMVGGLGGGALQDFLGPEVHVWFFYACEMVEGQLIAIL